VLGALDDLLGDDGAPFDSSRRVAPREACWGRRKRVHLGAHGQLLVLELKTPKLEFPTPSAFFFQPPIYPARARRNRFGLEADLLQLPARSLSIRGRDKGRWNHAARARRNTEKEVLACPGGRVLEKVGTYGHDRERPYELFVRRDCTGCELKCTTSRGRRVKRFRQHALVLAIEARMERDGEKMVSSAVQPWSQ
jgi:hypothetical protein